MLTHPHASHTHRHIPWSWSYTLIRMAPSTPKTGGFIRETEQQRWYRAYIAAGSIKIHKKICLGKQGDTRMRIRLTRAGQSPSHHTFAQKLYSPRDVAEVLTMHFCQLQLGRQNFLIVRTLLRSVAANCKLEMVPCASVNVYRMIAVTANLRRNTRKSFAKYAKKFRAGYS